MTKNKMHKRTDRSAKKEPHSLVRRFLRDESGNVIMWVICVMLILLMMSAFFIDMVHAMVVQRQLQSSADAAALAAAEVPANYPTSGTTYQLGTTNAGQYSGGSGDKNYNSDFSLSTNSVQALCLNAVAAWSYGSCGSSSTPNAMRVTQATSVPAYFSQMFGVPNLTVSATATAAVQGAQPLPYNVAILVDSTLSMDAVDGSTECPSLTQEQCALEGVQALLGNGGNGNFGLAPSVDSVALFTFPNVAASASSAGIVGSNGAWQCTTDMPSTDSNGNSYQNGSRQGLGNFYFSMLEATYGQGQYGQSGWSGTNNSPYSGRSWGLPYTFPPVPHGSSASYTPPSGTYGATYEVVPFDNNYRTSDSATTLNSQDALVNATGFVSNCGGLAPSNYDGNYGTYYAGAMYAAQAALVAEQAKNGNPNVMIILGDGNNNGPSDQQGQSPDVQSPSVGQYSAEITSTYKSASQLTYTPNSAAYTYPSGWLLGSNSSGTYPSSVGTCGQAVTAANYIKSYSPNSTQIYTIAYGAPTSSSSRNSDCPYDVGAGAYPGITPCQTMQWMATGGSSTESQPSNYFYSDYTVQGGDPACKANTSNSITSLVQIFQSIVSSLTRVRLISNNLT